VTKVLPRPVQHDKPVKPGKRFFDRLNDFGYARSYVRSVVLPPWWDESELEDPAGLLEARLRVKSCLGIPPELLDSESPAPLPTSSAHFRGGHPQDPHLQTVKLLATQIAELVSHAFRELPQHGFREAQVMRTHLLTEWGEPWLSFDCLARACWVQGIPLVHVGNLPNGRGVRKPHAMVVRTSSDRPVILLFRNHKSPAWLLWDLAHEVGHIASGHLEDTAMVWDEKLAPCRVAESDDTAFLELESQANAYAMELLTGREDFSLSIGQQSGHHIAHTAQNYSRLLKIDPGFLVLCNAYGKEATSYSKAQVALKSLPGQTPQRTCNDLLFSRLSQDLLPAEQLRFLQAVTAS
jgi:hypothetical protein